MKALIIFITVIFFFVNCGTKGDLSLEPEVLPLKISKLDIIQNGLNIILEFTFQELILKKKNFDINDVSKIYIYHSKSSIPEDKFKKKGSLIKKIKNPKLYILDNEDLVKIKIPFKAKDLDNKEHYFGIIYYLKKKKSPISVIKSIKSIVPYEVIDKVDLFKEKKNIVLKWKRPEFDLMKNKVSQIAGFNVYRKIEKEVKDSENENNLIGTKPVFVKLNDKFITDEFYEDLDISLDGKYFYKISTAYNNKIESSYSKIVSIELKDIYPPEIPENLFVFKGEGFMILNWEEVKNKDLSHYIIYRKKSKKGQFIKIADNITKSMYKDSKINKSEIYYYYVIAVDKKGNESEPSSIVKERY